MRLTQMAGSHRLLPPPACNLSLASSAAAALVSNPATPLFRDPMPPAPTWIAEVRSCTQSVFRVSACSLHEPTAWALSMAAVRHCLVFSMASLQAASRAGEERRVRDRRGREVAGATRWRVPPPADQIKPARCLWLLVDAALPAPGHSHPIQPQLPPLPSCGWASLLAWWCRAGCGRQQRAAAPSAPGVPPGRRWRRAWTAWRQALLGRVGWVWAGGECGMVGLAQNALL